MASALIGALHAVLGLDTAAFEKGLDMSQRELRKAQKEFAKAGKKLTNLGKDLSTYLTVPIIGAGAATLKMAGDFESSMNRVGIATQATSEQMARMKDLALEIGMETTKSASESAEAMEILAKAGMATEDILNGGARAAVALSEAAGSDLDPAASAITDTMQQFKKTTADLPMIINQITGAVNQSKFDFADFTMGMAMGGGVAASAGVEFEDFAAALAATSSQFNSGSDAGTSMKTFLLRMVPDTKKARVAMEQFGLSFYDANGQMKSMAEIAQMLQDKFAGMSEQDRTATFKTIFGTDAIRTAIGLMQQGAQGIEDMQARIAATDASAQAAQRMQGFNAEMEKLKGAIETLAITIADSGFLEAMSSLVSKIAEWVDWMSEAHPATLKWITILAGVAAAFGPVLMVFGGFFKTAGVLLPLLVKLGPVLSTLTALFVGLGRALIGLAIAGGPLTLIVLAVGAVYLAFKNWDKIKPILQNLRNAVNEYVNRGLAKIWESVKAKIDAVKDWFYGLYDAVVGHSYIPDMVDGIQLHMARLDAVMVAPAKKATSEAAQAFQQLQSTVLSIFNRLFPAEARRNQFLTELQQLRDYAVKAKLPVEQLEEAIRRLKAEYATDAFGERKGVSLPTGDDIFPDKMKVDLDSVLNEDLVKPSEDATAKTIEAFANMARDVAGSLRGMISSFKSGDILGGLSGILDIVGQIAGLFAGNKGGGSRVFNTGFGGFRAAGGPVVPGKSYVVGENGPEWFTPSRSGNIIPSNDTGPSRVMIVPSPYFDAVVDSRASAVAAPMVPLAATAGSANAQTSLRRQASRRLPTGM